MPSRRLGRSLGVNNVPYKHCTYSCVYCQLGPTTHLTVERRAFYGWEEVVEDVVLAVARVGPGNLDYVTFVPDGEPTLDINLGREIRGIREGVDVPVAVLTNGSLLSRGDVASDLQEADLVSVKVDAADPGTYSSVNRHHGAIDFGDYVEGVVGFARSFGGTLLTETMLVRGLNDGIGKIRDLARLVARIGPAKAYVAVPVRPPAEAWVRPPEARSLLAAYREFSYRLPGRVELLVGPEEGGFGGSEDDPLAEVLAILSVHPMRLEDVLRTLERHGLDAEGAVGRLLSSGAVELVEYEGRRYLVLRPDRRSTALRASRP